MYTSSYFRLAREYVESTGERWGICSAWHGLLMPYETIEPYDKTLRTLGDKLAFRTKFRSGMLAELESMGVTCSVDPGQKYATWDNPPTIVCFAGAAYANEIRQCMPGIDVAEPLAGLQIGERQQWFKRNTPTKPVQQGLFISKGSK